MSGSHLGTLLQLSFCATLCLGGQDASVPNAAVPNPAKHEDRTVVTGTYAPIPLEEADRTVDSLAIGQSPSVYRNAIDALQSEPAVDVRQRAPGVQGDLSIRGSSFGQTLVLIDGLRLNDAQTGHNNLDLPFPFAAIDRIEVLEGSGSTLYGADAVGGAVNFLTKAPEVTEVRVGAYGGSFGTNGQDGLVSYVRGPLTEEFTFTRELSTGFMANRDYRSLALGSESNWRSSLGLTRLLLGSSDRPFGAAGFYGNYPSWERTRGWFAGLSQTLGEHTELAFSFRRHTDLFDLFRYRPALYENRHATESWEAAIRRWNQLRANTRVYYGLEGYRDSIDSTNLGTHTRDRGAGYVSVDARALRRFSINAGVREEYFTGGRTVATPSLSGGYWLNSRVRFHASASGAFRLPTFTDLYYSDPANVGNPNLKAERAWSFEGGAHVNWQRNTADVVIFRRYDRDNIDYVRNSASSIWRAANIDNLRFTGVEAAWRWQISSGQRLDVTYAGLRGFQQALSGQQAKYLFAYPVHSGTLTWWGHLPQQVTTHLRTGVLQRYRQDAYPLVELSIEREWTHVKPYLQVNNAANAGYQEIPGVRLPGRSYIAGLELFSRRSIRGR